MALPAIGIGISFSLKEKKKYKTRLQSVKKNSVDHCLKTQSNIFRFIYLPTEYLKQSENQTMNTLDYLHENY